MSDETPPSNGNGAIKRDLAIVWMLGGCVAALVLIAFISDYRPPAQWDLVNKIVDIFANLILILTGALAVKTKA